MMATLQVATVALPPAQLSQEQFVPWPAVRGLVEAAFAAFAGICKLNREKHATTVISPAPVQIAHQCDQVGAVPQQGVDALEGHCHQHNHSVLALECHGWLGNGTRLMASVCLCSTTTATY